MRTHGTNPLALLRCIRLPYVLPRPPLLTRIWYPDDTTPPLPCASGMGKPPAYPIATYLSLFMAYPRNDYVVMDIGGDNRPLIK